MKQIIKCSDNTPVKIIDIDYLDSNDMIFNIIAYETKPHTTCQRKGLGILIHCTDNKYGFVYHKTLLRGSKSGATYKDCRPKDCVIRALDAGRKVMIFSSFKEFLQYASEEADEY